MPGTLRIRRSWARAAVSSAVAGLALAPGVASAAPGDVDPDWNGGTALTRYRPAGTPDAMMTSVLIDGQGRIVASGQSSPSGRTDGLLARLKPNGTPDETFDGDGYASVQYDSSGSPVTTGRGVLRDPSGRLGGGWATTAQHSARVARYAENGALDPAYGTDGLASVSAYLGEPTDGPFAQSLRNVLPTADGSTLAVIDGGRAGSGPSFWSNRAWVARLDPSGDPDPGFGTSGRAYGSAPAPNAGHGVGIASGVADPSGRVLAVGNTVIGGNSSTGKEAAIVYRFTADGQVDTSFGGGDGKVEFQAGLGSSPFSYGTSVAVAPDGSIYVGGSASTGNLSDDTTAFVAKLSAAGVEDGTFGARQVQAVSAGASFTGLRGVTVLVQGDGKPVLVGYGTTGGQSAMFIARYNQFGDPDLTFKGDGVATPVLPPSDYATQPVAAALTKFGKDVVIVGTSFDSGTQAFATRVNLRDPSEILVPENTSAPTLTGSPVPGQTLTCQPGTWQNSPTSVDVVWERAPRTTASPDDPAWTPVAGTIGTTYAVQAADLGSRVRCREVATNGDGSDTAPSGSKRVDAAGPLNTAQPSYVGLMVVGQKLTCSPGIWTNGPDLTYRWVRDGTEIPGAANAIYTLTGGDRGRQIRCRVYAANDVGGNVADSGPQLAVGAPPVNTRKPATVLTRTGGKATDIVLSCNPGTWREDYHQYDHAWQREGSLIAGATGSTYTPTIDDLGHNLACVEYSTNPAGRSKGAAGSSVLVPLPATGEPGKIFQAGGANHLDPVNMVALSGGFLRAAQSLALQRRADATSRARVACNGGIGRTAKLPEFGSVAKNYSGVVLGGNSLCGVLRNAPAAQIVQTNEGTFWRGGPCRLPNSLASPANAGAPNCPALDITVEPLDPAAPPSALAQLEQATLAPLRPVKVLWDVNRDGHTDAECGADAPILRSLYDRGHYTARAVIVSADSGQTGLYSIADLPLDFFSESASQQGSLRSAQVFACRTQLQPPASPRLPCVREATIGRAHVLGNLCPINERQIPESELNTLPPSVQQVLAEQSVNRGLRRASAADLGGLGSVAHVPRGSPTYDVTATLSALSTLGSGKFAVAKSWMGGLQDLNGFVSDKASFALDQIYEAEGTASVNGVSVVPGTDASVVLVPSDAGQAIKGLKAMTIASSKAQTLLGGLPIGDSEKLSTDLVDRLDVPAPPLKGANLDDLAQALKKKLDLGPFKLAGDAKVRLADDGSAFIDAYAELPSLTAGPGAQPIRTAVTVHGTRDGKVTLEGIHITAPQAYLGGLKLQGLAIDWDGNGLSVTGKLLFPPVDQGIAINRFRIDGNGRFKELDLDYLAGAGQGINVGPGVFLTKIGGGLSLDPDEVRGRAAFSVGPSSGGGCPTAGIDAQFVVHWSPAPWFVDATGDVGLMCIPVGNAHFHADQTGLVDLATAVKIDVGPIYVDGGIHGTLKLPRWQLDMHGEGGIRHVLSGQVKGLISNLGLAACGRVEIFPKTPLNDAVYLAGGAGVHFAGGRPPFTYAELLANIDLFPGCDLSGWSPFGRGRAVIAARATAHGAAGSGSSFTIARPAPKVVPLQLVGAGGSPRVRLRTPSGTVLDASTVGEDFTRGAAVSGLRDEAHDRTILFVRGEAGTWTVEPAAGSPAIVDIRRSSVLAAPKVTAKVSGRGADRRLTYRVASIAGQEVRFVEHSRGGRRDIVVVKNGGSGSARFVTSEGRGTRRTVVAEVSQGGLPRVQLTVARFSAPSPKAGTPKVRARRSGTKLAVSWSRATYAARYAVTIDTGTGRRLSLSPAGSGRSVVVGGFKRGEGARVRVVALTEAGRAGRAGTARSRGTLRYVTVKTKKRKLVVHHKTGGKKAKGT